MKHLKSSLITFIIAVACATCLVSCLDSVHDDEKNKLYVDTTTLTKETDGRYYFLSDSGIKIFSDNLSNPADSLLGLRFLITFQVKEKYNDEWLVYHTSDPLRMFIDPIRTDYENIKTIANDEISKKTSMWISGKYLNITTEFLGSGKIKHDYYMFMREKNSDTLKLEFRHDNNNDQQNFPLITAYSYDIKEYMENCGKDTLVISLKANIAERPNPKNDIIFLVPTKNNTKTISAF